MTVLFLLLALGNVLMGALNLFLAFTLSSGLSWLNVIAAIIAFAAAAFIVAMTISMREP